jgi:hypothetical protein
LVQKDFYDFIKAEHPVILNWNGTQTDTAGIYKRAQGGETKLESSGSNNISAVA